jgi:hypothetical protein
MTAYIDRNAAIDDISDARPKVPAAIFSRSWERFCRDKGEFDDESFQLGKY